MSLVGERVLKDNLQYVRTVYMVALVNPDVNVKLAKNLVICEYNAVILSKSYNNPATIIALYKIDKKIICNTCVRYD